MKTRLCFHVVFFGPQMFVTCARYFSRYDAELFLEDCLEGFRHETEEFKKDRGYLILPVLAV